MKRIFALSAIALWLFSACSVDPVPDRLSDGGEAEPVENESNYIQNELIVELDDSTLELVEKDFSEGRFRQTKAPAINEAFANLGVVSVERLFPDAGEWEERHRAYGLHKLYVLKFSGETSQTKAVEDLSGLQAFDVVERPHKIRPAAMMDDPRFSSQWHFYNDGTLAPGYKAGCDINVVPVWERYTGGSPEVIVAVVDGGIDMEHEDLKDVCIPGGPSGSRNFVNGSFDITAENHGTHVAGTIGAINNNGKGVCGIAGGLDGKGGVRLMSCQIFQGEQSGSTSQAIIWGADHGAVICQNSWGYDYKTAQEAAAGSVSYSDRKAIEYFIDNAGKDAAGVQTGPMAGGVVFFAAGNDGWSDAWPAKYDKVIAVGATNGAFQRSYYSNYGVWVDICAPGGDSKVGHMIMSTKAGNSYGTLQGTSMSCPHVSGVAALLVSYFGGEGFTNEMLLEKLLGGAKKGVIPTSDRIGNLLDAKGAFAYGFKLPPDKVEKFSVESSSNNALFRVSIPKDDDDGVPDGILAMVSRNSADFNDLNPLSLPSSVKSVRIPCGGLKVKDVVEGVVDGLEFGTVYYAAVMAYDYGQNYSEISAVRSLRTGINNPPIIETDYPGPFTVKAHESLRVPFRVYDPDGHDLTVKFTPGSGAATFSKGKDNYELSIVGKIVPAGKYCAVINVSDPFGLSSEMAVDYEILENHAPEFVKTMDNMVFSTLGGIRHIDLSEYFRDPDDEPLKFTTELSKNSILYTATADNTLNITSLSYGSTDVTVTGTDACGLKCSQTFKVLVRDADVPLDIYPNPVVKNAAGVSMLYVSGGEEEQIHVKIEASSGRTIFEGSESASAFNPFEINMDACAAGRYVVTAEAGGKTTVRQIVKL